MIVFDLDGTLINSSVRMFTVYKSLVPSSSLSQEEYWHLKRSGMSSEHILEYCDSGSAITTERFRTRWLSTIESQTFIDLDTEQVGASVLLRHLSKFSKIALVTSRQSRRIVDYQLEIYGWRDFFTLIEVTGVHRTKIQAIEEVMPPAIDWFIGDSCIDITTARHFGAKVAVVCNGFESRERLSGCQPDELFNNLTSLKGLLFANPEADTEP